MPALNRLCRGAMDPGLRRDDDHASVCVQFDYSLFRGDDELIRHKRHEVLGR